VLTQPSDELTGQFLIDEQVLRDTGVTDFTHYAVDPQAELLLDFFVE
jgi:citronellol/citronellal dehydrogenase